MAVLVIYTGGTIGMVHTPGGLAPYALEGVRQWVPELNRFEFPIDFVSFETPIDSSNIGHAEWVQIALLVQENYEKYTGFVVLHGSDTMAYSSAALSFMLQGLQKPVIFTGSQLPMGAIRTDARENLLTAIEIAAGPLMGHPVVPEVCIYFDYFLLRGNRATKVDADSFEAFRSPNHPPLAEVGIRIRVHEALLLRPQHGLQVHTDMQFLVGSLRLYPGIPRSQVQGVLFGGHHAVIMQAFGSGNAPLASWFIDDLGEAARQGVVVLNITQCHSGTVMMGLYETSARLLELGVVGGTELLFEAATTKTMHLLGKGLRNNELRLALTHPLAGEMRG